MDKKVHFIVIGLISVALLLVVGCSAKKKQTISDKNESSSEVIAETTTAIQEAETVQQEETTTEKTKKKDKKKSKKTTKKSTETEVKTKADNTESPANTTSKKDNENSQKAKDEEKDKSSEAIKLPYMIPNSEIELQYMNSYTGLFVEDGSNKKVKNITAIKIKNKSDQVVEYGTLELKRGDTTLQFTFSDLPADSEMIVLEKNKTKYKKANISYVTSSFGYIEDMSLMESEVKIEPTAKNGITVTNLTDETIPTLRLFYKYQLDSGEYIGGITYTAKIQKLEAEKSITIYPSHFATEGSIIVMVRKYDV